MLADRYGRKRILIGQLRCLVCSRWQRRLHGISPPGLCAADDRCRAGGGVAESYALTSEAAGPRFRGTAVSLMYAVFPLARRWRRRWVSRGQTCMANGVLGRWCGAVDSGAAIMRWLPESTVFAGEKQAAPPLVRYLRQKRQPRRCCCGCVIFHSAGGLHVDQLAAAAFGGAGFQPSQAAGVMFALQMGAARGR